MAKKYTEEDIRKIIPEPLTGPQMRGVLLYVNRGDIPPADECINCIPNQIRKLISRIQVATKKGEWPPSE